MSETDLTAAIVEALNTLPDVIAFRNNTGVARVHGSHVRYGLGNGSPDVVAVVKPWGHFLGLEVKLPRERAEPHQLRWADRVCHYGASYYLVRSVPEAFDAVGRVRALLTATLGYTSSADYMKSVRDIDANIYTKHLTPCARCNRFLAACATRMGIDPHTTGENVTARDVAQAIANHTRGGRQHGN